MKPKTYKPKSVKEAINDLQTFFVVDLYSLFRPEEEIEIDGKKEIFTRKDFIKNEKEFWEYLDAHFNILREQIVELIGKGRFEGNRK